MKKVAIVARAPSSRFDAPFADREWEIWNLSPMAPPKFTDLPRWDRWYELHHLEGKNVECPGYINWLKPFGDQVWIREPHPELPEARIYPRNDIFAEIQKGWVNEYRFYNNSVALMIAHAIYEGVGELAIYGTDMCQVSEYGTQKPSCEALLGYAAGRGIQVTVPENCDLLKCQRIYGLESETPWERKIVVHEKELETKLERYHRELNESRQQMVGAASAHGEMRNLLESLNGETTDKLVAFVTERCLQLEDINKQHRHKADGLDAQIKMTTGALEEIRYQKQFNP